MDAANEIETSYLGTVERRIRSGNGLIGEAKEAKVSTENFVGALWEWGETAKITGSVLFFRVY